MHLIYSFSKECSRFNTAKEMLSEDRQKEEYFLGIGSKSQDSEDALVVSDEFFIKNWFDKSLKKGFDLLFKKYYTNLCNHAIRYVYSKEVAEDNRVYSH